MNDNLVSFVIPCYNCENTISDVLSELKMRMSEISDRYAFEVILINDGSRDNTFEVIKKICDENKNVHGINMAKNFGQHSAMMAGFRMVSGAFVICLDDDGQMPLESIREMLEVLETGKDVVFGRYKNKKHSALKNAGSRINNMMCCFLLEKPRDLQMNSFWGARRFVTDEMIKYEGAYPYIAGLILRTTRNFANIDVKHRSRANGRTGYSFKKLISLWMNGFTAFSVKPLRIATFCGCTCSVLGFMYGIFTIIRKLVNPDILVGYSSIIALLLFIGGMMMLMLGIIGEYIGRIYICINKSPQYVIKEVVNAKSDACIDNVKQF